MSFCEPSNEHYLFPQMNLVWGKIDYKLGRNISISSLYPSFWEHQENCGNPSAPSIVVTDLCYFSRDRGDHICHWLLSTSPRIFSDSIEFKSKLKWNICNWVLFNIFSKYFQIQLKLILNTCDWLLFNIFQKTFRFNSI